MCKVKQSSIKLLITFLRSIHSFSRHHKEFEGIADSYSYNKVLVEDYKLQELTRSLAMNKVVFDVNELHSPYYPQQDYLDPSKQIFIPHTKDVYPYNKSQS